MVAENTLKGLGLFSLEIIHLISLGKSEDIKTIEQHISTNDVVEYISKKYDKEFSVKFDNSTYDNNEINKYFNNFDGYINDNEERKYGIVNDNDGLLLILALITDKVEYECQKWSASDDK